MAEADRPALQAMVCAGGGAYACRLTEWAGNPHSFMDKGKKPCYTADEICGEAPRSRKDMDYETMD